jgi:hypothetical protein
VRACHTEVRRFSGLEEMLSGLISDDDITGSGDWSCLATALLQELKFKWRRLSIAGAKHSQLTRHSMDVTSLPQIEVDLIFD